MNPKLKEKTLESLSAVLPITGIMLFISIFLVPMKIETMVMFLVGAVMLILGIAFDSGGVAGGPMTSTFLLPLSIGTCQAVGEHLMTDAFGVVALVALTPLIA